MKRITSQKQAREVQRLPFCYLCARQFDDSSEINREHVVAGNIFRPIDKQNFPLILPSHKKCNAGESEYDETVGQLIRFLHPEDSRYHKLELTGFYSGAEIQVGTVSGVPLEPTIWRWVRGFHAALYHEPLPNRPRTYDVLPPIPEMKIGDRTADDVEPRAQYFKFTRELVRNRSAQNVDAIICYNEKLRYECVWIKAENGMPICIFALDIYDWGRLADEYPGPKRTCLGCYFIDNVPTGASQGTALIFEIPGVNGLNPFTESAGSRSSTSENSDKESP